MAVEQAKAFLERLKTDQDFVKKLEAIDGDDAKAKAIKDMGYNFTEEELKGVLKESAPELSDADLDAIAGGGSASWIGAGAGVVGVGVGIIAAA